MKGIIVRVLLNVVGLWLAATLVPGIDYLSTAGLIWSAIALGLVNAIVRPVLVLLTFPITLLTLGLFLLVINAAMLNLADWFVDDLVVRGFIDSIFGAIIIGLISWAGSAFVGPDGTYVIIERR